MLPKSCGKLLYNAVRETLETMAFAEVVPCSIKVAGEEFAQDDDFAVITDLPGNGAGSGGGGGWGNALPQGSTDVWGTATPAVSQTEESWGSSPTPTSEPVANTTGDGAADDWGTPTSVANDAAWGMETPPSVCIDPWGDANLADACVSGQNRPKEADFDNMASAQTEWCWACMNVNSPDIHAVWFIVPQSLAHALMQNMYAGEDVQLDTPIVRDLIAELTNVLGGRLMLLLEELGGKFTLTVPSIGVGFPDIPEVDSAQSVVCKIVVDNQHPVITVLCFNQGGRLDAD